MDRVYSEHPAIDSDIHEIWEYIHLDNPAAALSVVETISDALLDIREYPFRSPQYKPITFLNETLRRRIVLPYRNYSIFYSVTEEETRALYVHHAARDFEAWHRQEKRH